MPRDTVASCATEDSTPDAWRARGRAANSSTWGTMPAWTRGPFGTDGASWGGTTCRPTPELVPSRIGWCDPSSLCPIGSWRGRRPSCQSNLSGISHRPRCAICASKMSILPQRDLGLVHRWDTSRLPWSLALRGAQSRMEPSDPCTGHGGCRGWSPRPTWNRHCGRCEASNSARVRARRPASSEVWRRHEKPSARMIASGPASSIAGSRSCFATAIENS